jgi:transcriptional regulator with XRE-family HTH domain
MKKMTEVKKEISRIAQFVDQRLGELRGVKNQREVSEEAGYTNQNMITMIKQGYSKVAIDRVTALAKALDVEPRPLMRLALEQFYSPAAIRDLEMAFGEMLTANERRLVDIYRRTTKGKDPAITPDMAEKIKAVF